MSSCKMCKALNAVGPRDVNAINSVLELKDITNVELAEIMTKNGFPMTETSIRRHVRRHKDK